MFAEPFSKHQKNEFSTKILLPSLCNWCLPACIYSTETYHARYIPAVTVIRHRFVFWVVAVAVQWFPKGLKALAMLHTGHVARMVCWGICEINATCLCCLISETEMEEVPNIWEISLLFVFFFPIFLPPHKNSKLLSAKCTPVLKAWNSEVFKDRNSVPLPGLFQRYDVRMW